ncbi:sulfurtransferase TusA family protein [Sphingomonas sp. CJ99]
MIRRIDARGLRCPWPAVRLARALREGGGDQPLEIAADDPAAAVELAIVASQHGRTIEKIATDLFRLS